MEYRAVTQEERLELMELQAQTFFFTYDRKRYAEEMAGGDAWQNGRAAINDQGKLVAGLDLIPFDAWFDGTAVGMGGIGGVASRPEYRHGGNVRGLMQAVLSEMYERGDVFSTLYPFSNQYYRKFGYEVCIKLAQVKAPLEPLRAFRQPGRAERFIPGEGGTDPSPIIEVYNDFARQYNLCVDRQGWRWRGLLEQDPMTSRRHVYVWYYEDGRPGAYVIFKAEPDHDANEMHVKEAAWRTWDALLGLLGFMGGFCSNLKTIIWELPPNVDPNLLWPECKDIKTELFHNGMNRVVNAAKAIRLMKIPEGKGSVKISVADEILPVNSGTYKIDWENGEGRTRRVKGAAADMECPAHALAQLVTGYLPLEQLRLRPDIVINSKAEELGQLFVKKDVYLMDKF